MMILAIEFSSSKRSVAVVADGTALGLAAVESVTATPALALVDHALKSADVALQSVDRIAVGLGPGSYTGIRMALALIQGMALAKEVEVVGISSMLALATDALRIGVRQKFHVAVDAQRREFYLGQYQVSDEQVRESSALRIVAEAEIRQLLQAGESVVGPDLTSLLPEVWPLLPDARIVGRLANNAVAGMSTEELRPIYLRQTAFTKTS